MGDGANPSERNRPPDGAESNISKSVFDGSRILAEGSPYPGLWAGLLSVTEIEPARIGSDKFDPEFIFKAFTWYLEGLGSEEHAVGLDNYPDLLYYFSSI